jgi:hypothetical protein
MARYGVKRETILEHLYKYGRGGNPLRKEPLEELLQLPEAVRSQVFAAFDQLGTYALSLVFENLEGKISYEEIKILRLCYIS